MIPLDRAVVARLETHGERFEILVDPDLAVKIRHGEAVDIEDAVAAIFIFENASRAEKSSEEALQKVFQTTDFETIARRIIEKGEIHLTSEQRRHLIEEKRGQVITFIARHAINPQTGLPHPPARIEMAMEEAKVTIDPFKPFDDLVAETMKSLRPLIPIRFEELRIAVRIPPDTRRRRTGTSTPSPGSSRRSGRRTVLDLRGQDTRRDAAGARGPREEGLEGERAGPGALTPSD